MRYWLLFLLATLASVAPALPVTVTNTGKTFSMGKVFPPGATARVIDVPFSTHLKGYVVCVRRTGLTNFLTHRCIAEGLAGNGKKWIITKGDANRWEDFPRWSESEFYGVLDLP